MIDQKVEKIMESKWTIQAMADGINPLNGEKIKAESFLNDAKVIRQLLYLLDYLDKQLECKPGISKTRKPKKPKNFIISPEEKNNVHLPVGKIGVNDFAQVVNLIIDVTKSKKLNGAVINRKLKLMGILSEGRTMKVTFVQ
jgi:hypothetical protein